MANMSPKKNPIPEQDPNVRNKNFEEVALGYTVEMAVDEANRCLNCPRPACMQGCPVNVKIPQFIARVREQDFKGAYHRDPRGQLPARRLRPRLPAGAAVREQVRARHQGRAASASAVWSASSPTGTPRERRRDAREARHERPPRRRHRLRPVPASTCAGDLAKHGLRRDRLSSTFHKAGGVLAYGIPEFRLPKAIVAEAKSTTLVAMGVNIVCDATIGKCMTIDELLGKDADHLLGDDKYEAVFIGSGAGLPAVPEHPGSENLLRRVTPPTSSSPASTSCTLTDERYDTPLMPIQRDVAVVGARQRRHGRRALRQASGRGDVYGRLPPRRWRRSPPARKRYEHAEGRGHRVPPAHATRCEILADDKGWVRGLKCIRMELGEPDEKGRRRPIEVPGSEFEMAVRLRHHGARHLPQPAAAQGHPGPRVQRPRRHRRQGRQPCTTIQRRRVRRRRRRHRRGHRHQGDGRRQEGRRCHRRIHPEQVSAYIRISGHPSDAR